MAVNKVVYGNTTLIDLTEDTITPEVLMVGYTAHKADGTVIVGTLNVGSLNEQIITLQNRVAELEMQLEHAILDSDADPILDSGAP